MFLKNKYTKWYFSIIEKAKSSDRKKLKSNNKNYKKPFVGIQYYKPNNSYMIHRQTGNKPSKNSSNQNNRIGYNIFSGGYYYGSGTKLYIEIYNFWLKYIVKNLFILIRS